MGVLKVQAELGHISGLARDKVVNTFCIVHPNAGLPSGAELATLAGEIEEFYDQAICSYLSTVLSRAALACTTKIYDLTDKLSGGVPLGSPIYETLWTLGAASVGTNMPSECSAVLTIEGVGWSDQPVNTPLPPDGPAGDAHPQARRRGRLYIGPLQNIAIAEVAEVPKLDPTFQTLLLNMGNWFADEQKAKGAGWFWAVWSRTNAQVYEVESVSSTDDVDIQRRRGERGGTRVRQVV